MAKDKKKGISLTGIIAAVFTGITAIATIVGLIVDIPDLLNTDRPYVGVGDENTSVEIISTVTAAPTADSGDDLTNPTAAFTPTPTFFVPDDSIVDCDLDSEYIADVTIPDGVGVPVGAVFEKIWLIENTGTCTWNNNYRVEQVTGQSSLTIQDYSLGTEQVPPGEEVQLIVVFSLDADARVGQKHFARVQLISPNGDNFGQRPYVEIVANP